MNDGFKVGSGCFPCELCGKLTRQRDTGSLLCKVCEDLTGHENSHADNDFPGDDCGWVDCPVKNYSPEQKWWSNGK